MPNIFFSTGTLKLAGNLFQPKEKSSVGVLLLHGASNKGKYRYFPLQESLYKKGISSFAYDTRGVGESDGSFSDSSLANRSLDAIAAYKTYKKYVNKIVIVGSSMGGYVALELVNLYPEIVGTVLIGPAAYTPQAENIPLGPAFTKVISEENSWKASKSFDFLASYKGKVLIIYGEKDRIIPEALQQKYKGLLKSTDEFKVLKNSGHNFLGQKDEEKAFNEGINCIEKFVSSFRI